MLVFLCLPCDDGNVACFHARRGSHEESRIKFSDGTACGWREVFAVFGPGFVNELDASLQCLTFFVGEVGILQSGLIDTSTM